MTENERQQIKLTLIQQNKRNKRLSRHSLSILLVFAVSILTHYISLPILSHDILATIQINNIKDNDYNSPSPIKRDLLYPRTNHLDTKTRMLWGIFTTLHSNIEAQRRKIIRNTYLSCDTIKICPINNISPDCIIIYTFVVGANTDNNVPTMLIHPNDSFPITVNPPQTLLSTKATNSKQYRSKRSSFYQKSIVATEVASDIVYLNIKENMEQGKSETWFKYATILEQEIYSKNTTFPFTIDYVGKFDTDTVIYSMEYLHLIQNHLPKNPIRYYGGRQFFGSPRAGSLQARMRIGPSYMSGAAYFMSLDLANFINSDDCHQEKLRVDPEDLSIGNFVQSHPLGVTNFRIGKHEAWHHFMKDVGEFVLNWRDHSYHCPNETLIKSESRISFRKPRPYNYTDVHFSIEYFRLKPATLASLQDKNSEYIPYYHPIHYNGTFRSK